MGAALQEQLGKLNPGSGAQSLLGQVRAEQAAAAQQRMAANGGISLEQQIAQQNAEFEAHDAEQRLLEAEHGKLATAATQFGRGALDAILAPGALVGAGAEGLGELTGSEGLREFGRDLGRAANGEQAFEAAAYLFGGGGQRGLTTAERVAKDVADQEKAWPALAAVSRMTGSAAPMVLGGGLSTGARGAALIGASAFEGSSVGAQAAYEKNLALRDVLASTLVGGALGAGTAAAGEGLVALVNSKPLKAAARELGEDANLRAAGIDRTALRGLAGDAADAAEAKASELASELGSYKFQSGPAEGKSLMRWLKTEGDIQEGVKAAAAETTSAVQAARAEVAQKAAETTEGQLLGQAMAAGADVPAKQLDDLAARALVASGGDVEAFKGIADQARRFQELSALIDNAAAAPKVASPLGAAIGTITTVADLVGGGGSVSALAKGFLTSVGHKVVQQRAASTIATLANNIVLDNVSTAVSKVMPAITMGVSETGARAAAPEATKPPAPLTPEQKQDRYREQLDTVTKAVTQADPEQHGEMIAKSVGDFPPALVMSVGGDMGARLAQLHADMPKPEPNIRGKAFETLSQQQVQLANAMYEATVAPMSVFEDFAAGNIDYDKVQYAWKQYPGLKQAAQAGLMDVMQVQLTESKRATIPDGMLSQLDNLFGFEGQLQPTLDRAFSNRMNQLMQPPPNKPAPQPGGSLQTPLSQPTFTERLSGQRS